MSDLISRQAVLKLLSTMPSEEAITKAMLIQNVKYMSSAQPEKRTEERTETHACDCISRKAAIDAIYKVAEMFPYRIPGQSKTYRQYNEAWSDACDASARAIEGLPSAQPGRKRGKWIYGEDEYGIDGYHCDKCGFFVPWDYAHKFINYIEDYNFCPGCGADMREVDDERPDL